MVQVGIVAICQFGGKFVSNNDGSMSYGGGDAHAIDLNPDLTLDDFKSEITSLFDIDMSTMSIKYFLPNNRQTLITISSDRDLQRMIDFHGSSTTVDVYILDKANSSFSIQDKWQPFNCFRYLNKCPWSQCQTSETMIRGTPSFPSLMHTDDDGQGKVVAIENVGTRSDLSSRFSIQNGIVEFSTKRH
ncbi:unnamed protein product [Spirodela intermedia]|uniref:PB1 domain-containing protein n=1 Tax=Spirodela intermedia TaxID=51605 RepID=A0A7I8KJ99_SPIIN|nr:unnamed protein product [Spirodela intermedia]